MLWCAQENLPLDFVTVHEKLVDPALVPRRVRVVQVPHGLYDTGKPSSPPALVRQQPRQRQRTKTEAGAPQHLAT